MPLTHVPPDEALAQALICVEPEQAVRMIALIESDGLLSPSQLSWIVASSPRRTLAALRRAGWEDTAPA